jgi:hypothetical protein
MTFPTWQQPHDPLDAKTYAFRFFLNDGDVITSGTIDFVDPTGETIVTTDLTLNNIIPGVSDDYGAVFFRPEGGTYASLYWLRCTAVTQLGDTYVLTMGLRVKAT